MCYYMSYRFGPAHASLLDQLVNDLGTPVETLAFFSFGRFAFGTSFHPNFGDYLPLDRPVDFYSVRFDFTAPNMPDLTITSSFLRLGATSGNYGIGIVTDTRSEERRVGK